MRGCARRSPAAPARGGTRSRSRSPASAAGVGCLGDAIGERQRIDRAAAALIDPLLEEHRVLVRRRGQVGGNREGFPPGADAGGWRLFFVMAAVAGDPDSWWEESAITGWRREARLPVPIRPHPFFTPDLPDQPVVVVRPSSTSQHQPGSPPSGDSKRGSQDRVHFSLFSDDLPDTPGSDSVFEVQTTRSPVRTRAPFGIGCRISMIRATPDELKSQTQVAHCEFAR